MRIHDQRFGRLTEQERIEIARLLIKAGYTVRLGKVKDGSKTVAYVEAVGDGEEKG